MSQAAPRDLLLDDALDKLVHHVEDNARVARIWIRHHKEIRQMLIEN